MVPPLLFYLSMHALLTLRCREAPPTVFAVAKAVCRTRWT